MEDCKKQSSVEFLDFFSSDRDPCYSFSKQLIPTLF